MDNLPSFTTSHAHPLPKRLPAASANCFLKSSNDPNPSAIASDSTPAGLPPPFGLNVSQKNAWFRCPPTLFLNVVRNGSGTRSYRDTNASPLNASNSGYAASALFALVIYAW